MYLFFDTETTGLPRNWKASVEDVDNWPRMVQVAWIIYNRNGKEIESCNYIIKPEGFIIPKESSLIHGITNKIADEKGEDLKKVLKSFEELVNEASALVAHNISFDEKIIGAEFIRKEMINCLDQKEKICTMRKATNFCALKGKYGNKWPTLSELHQKLFGADFEDAHDAAIDIKITAKCFWELKRRGEI